MPTPIITAALFDGQPYAEITINPEYKGRGGEREMIQKIFTAMKEWRDFDPEQENLCQEEADHKYQQQVLYGA
jgi:hypothetical protein